MAGPAARKVNAKALLAFSRAELLGGFRYRTKRFWKIVLNPRGAALFCIRELLEQRGIVQEDQEKFEFSLGT